MYRESLRRRQHPCGGRSSSRYDYIRHYSRAFCLPFPWNGFLARLPAVILRELLFIFDCCRFDRQSGFVVFDICVEACYVFGCRRYFDAGISVEYVFVQEVGER